MGKTFAHSQVIVQLTNVLGCTRPSGIKATAFASWNQGGKSRGELSYGSDDEGALPDNLILQEFMC